MGDDLRVLGIQRFPTLAELLGEPWTDPQLLRWLQGDDSRAAPRRKATFRRLLVSCVHEVLELRRAMGK